MKIISELYKKFSLAEGSQHIASEYALEKLQDVVTKFQVKNVLEVGLGIGSIAGTLLTLNKDLVYTGTEANKFCLKVLPQNIGSAYQRLEILEGLNSVSREKKFDLVIIDGNDPGLEEIQYLMAASGIIAIEGDRMPQQKLLRKYFPAHRCVHTISFKKNRNYSPFPPSHWQGGLKIIFVQPNVPQLLWWGREKLKTKIKYLYRS